MHFDSLTSYYCINYFFEKLIIMLQCYNDEIGSISLTLENTKQYQRARVEIHNLSIIIITQNYLQ